MLTSSRCCLIGALAFSCLTSLVSGEAVETLTSGNFEDRINQADIIVVKFYAPWCGHCKAMAPAYEEAARRLLVHSPPIPLAKVDATQEPGITQESGVRGFPTLKIFRKGAASDYGGPRDADGIVAYMEKQVQDMPIASGGKPWDQASGSSPLLIAKLCRDQTCGDDEFPIMDFDQNENRCVCSKHPCWDDNGQVHSCLTPNFPHLHMIYHEDGRLECSCNAKPQYVSTYIAKEQCRGHKCEQEEFPVLDYVPEEGHCVCKKNPCVDIAGVKHDCSDPAFPILLYREEKNTDGSIRQVCECKKRIIDKKAEGEL
jgi:protein disulfide-isomerase-like protein